MAKWTFTDELDFDFRKFFLCAAYFRRPVGPVVAQRRTWRNNNNGGIKAVSCMWQIA